MLRRKFLVGLISSSAIAIFGSMALKATPRYQWKLLVDHIPEECLCRILDTWSENKSRYSTYGLPKIWYTSQKQKCFISPSGYLQCHKNKDATWSIWSRLASGLDYSGG